MNAVAVGFFSMTSGAVNGDDTAYLRWHLLDHLPEQYSIPGIRLGTRWRADDECVAMRLAATDDLAPVRHVVSYLMADPADQTLTSFARLGRRLAEEGRYPEPATPHLLGAFERHRAYAAPSARVSADAIPFRPHRGVYLLVERLAPEASVDAWWRWHHEEHVPALLATDGVAGVYSFRSSPVLGEGAEQGSRFGTAAPWDPARRNVTVVYVDGDVAATSTRLAPLVRRRWADNSVTPRLAGPFRSPTAHEAWPAGS